MKIKIISLCFMLALPAVMLSYHVQAAEEENGFSDIAEPRTSRATLQENGINNLTSQQPRISRRQAMNLASGRYEGRVLGVVQVENKNWRVRMDRDGTVFNVFVNSNSGAVSAASD